MRTILPKRAVLVPDNATRVFKGIIYDTYHWEQELYNGTKTTFEMLKRPDTVKVIAIENDHILVLEQEQPNQGLFYDIPGGIHDHDEEDELAAIKRELLEETGMVFNSWKLVNIVQPNLKIEQFVYTFVASGLKEEIEQKLDGGEKIKVKLTPLDEAKTLLSPPMGRFMPEEIKNASSIDDVLNLEEYR